MGVCVLLLNQLRSRLLLFKTCSAKNISCCQTFQIEYRLAHKQKKTFLVAKYSSLVSFQTCSVAKKHFLLPNNPDSNSFQITFSLRASAFEGVSFMVLKMTYIYHNQYWELNLNSTSMQVIMVCYASWHGIRPPNPDNIRYCLLSWMFVLRSLISHYLSTNIMRAIREYLCAFFFRASLSDSYSLISFRFSYQCFSNKEQCYIYMLTRLDEIVFF